MPMGATAIMPGFRHRKARKRVEDETDDRLIARVQSGDDAAFEAIYDRYARGVFAFCVHMLGSREAGEDALQMTFVSAYRAIRSGGKTIALQPWLYTIARNRCLSDLRGRHGALDLDELAIDKQDPNDVADQVHRREKLRETLEDMQRLPADQRAALVLLELGDHSHKEIASVLGVRSDKVKALVFQARQGLMRGRRARDYPCSEVHERLATLQGKVPPRSMTRAHIDRCPSCAAFEAEVLRQRAALALILPLALSGELKASVLGSALGGGGVIAAGAGACGGGGGAVAAGTGTCGSGVIAAGGVAAGGAGGSTALTGGGVAGSFAASVAGAAGGAATGGAPVAALTAGVTAVGAEGAAVGFGSLGGTGLAAKILTTAAIAAGAVGMSHISPPVVHPPPLARVGNPTLAGGSLTTLTGPARGATTTPTSAAPPAGSANSSLPGSGVAGVTDSASPSTPATGSSPATGSAGPSTSTTGPNPAGSVPLPSPSPPVDTGRATSPAPGAGSGGSGSGGSGSGGAGSGSRHRAARHRARDRAARHRARDRAARHRARDRAARHRARDRAARHRARDRAARHRARDRAARHRARDRRLGIGLGIGRLGIGLGIGRLGIGLGIGRLGIGLGIGRLGIGRRGIGLGIGQLGCEHLAGLARRLKRGQFRELAGGRQRAERPGIDQPTSVGQRAGRERRGEFTDAERSLEPGRSPGFVNVS